MALNGQNTEDVITWLFEPDSFAPLARLQGEQRQSIVCDHLGTPLQMYGARGQLSWAAELDSYGAVRKQRGEAGACPFRYQGQYEDVETGLYYNRFRYYDPHAGQYISQDPIGLTGGDALYAYVHDPTNWVDTFGLKSSCPPDTTKLNRRQALNQAKDRAGIPRSQQPEKQSPV